MAFDKSEFIEELRKRNPGEDEFVQAVEEVLDHIAPVIDKNDTYQKHSVIDRLTEPDRIIQFRVTWQDDEGIVRTNRGWRVQHTNAIGPYKGGLRFDPSVSPSILKFLAFEQTFKNALTGLPMGAGKGGADFNPKGKSDGEIMRFCQAFMSELYRHIGPKTDVPAGDIGVGPREIGYMFGVYKKITNRFSGSLTGKGLEFGGAPMRVEATGFGLIYFLECMLKQHDQSLEEKEIVISGAGNVAIHAALKAVEKGAQVLTLSNSSGTLYLEGGFSEEQLKKVKKSAERLEDLASELDAEWLKDKKPWHIDCDIALPCATQNELDEDDAKQLIDNDVMAVAEGANMPCTMSAIKALQQSAVLYGPAKAANAGGVAISGLEMSLNAGFEKGDADNLNERLKEIMRSIHQRCVGAAEKNDGVVDYAQGANIAGFKKVADAIVAFGVI